MKREPFVVHNPSRFDLLVTEEPIERLRNELVQFIVPDTWEFMHEVGLFLRKRTTIPIIATTGSVGKSSVCKMIDCMLSRDYEVLSNRNNHNTRAAIPLYMDRLVTSPEVLNLEVSLNALNYKDKGPATQFVAPTISVVTSVGHAHVSGIPDLNDLARLKSNVFKGLQKGGVAILNKDIAKDQFEILRAEALTHTDQLLTYSVTSRTADIYLLELKQLKYVTEVTISFRNRLYTYYLELSSMGMVENSLAAISVLIGLGLDIDRYIGRLQHFRSLPKVMELKQGYLQNKKVDIYDDTHNAAIPSMINSIETFAQKVPYYNGKKILVLGQVADLGNLSEELHDRLVPLINNSGADILLGYGEYMKRVVDQVTIPSLWFDNLIEYEQVILKNSTEDSLLLLKGSMSGSDYNQISGVLEGLLTKSRK